MICTVRLSRLRTFAFSQLLIWRLISTGFLVIKLVTICLWVKPILAHVSQGAAGLIRSNAALASNPGDVESLAGNIQRFLVNRELINVMGAAARQYYLECYEYDSVVLKLARLISN